MPAPNVTPLLDSRRGMAEAREGFVPQIVRGERMPLAGAIQAANEAQALSLPLYGRIAAGTPIEALRDNSTTVDVPVSLLGSGAHYCLEVQGDSMVEAGIQNGDIAIIRSADSAESGEIVVALIDDSEATLKRLRKKAPRSRSSRPTPRSRRASSDPTGSRSRADSRDSIAAIISTTQSARLFAGQRVSRPAWNHERVWRPAPAMTRCTSASPVFKRVHDRLHASSLA
jgi:hypothetical protein